MNTELKRNFKTSLLKFALDAVRQSKQGVWTSEQLLSVTADAMAVLYGKK